VRRLVLLGLFDSSPYCEGSEACISSVYVGLIHHRLKTDPNVKPAAAAASCRSPDEVGIETSKDRGFQQEGRVSKIRCRTKEHEQYGRRGGTD
jgi:hypothetical protein